MRIKAIVNPVSGQKRMRRITAKTLTLLEERGSLRKEDIFYTSKNNCAPSPSFFKECDIVVVAGGDGTLHNSINIMKQNGIDIPIAYLPTGTMNDYGSCLNLPRNPYEFCKMIEEHEQLKADLGISDGVYFHYSISGGGFCTISHTTNQKFKNLFGKAAYYLAAVFKFPKIFRGTRIRIESKEVTKEENAILYIVSISPVAGGFKKLLPDAKIDDGYLHVLILKKCPLFRAYRLFKKINKGKHLNSPDVLYFKTDKVKITQVDEKTVMTDIDGEYSTSLTINAEIIPKGLTMLIPKRVKGKESTTNGGR